MQRLGSCQPEGCGSACCRFVYVFQRMAPVEREFMVARGIPVVRFPTGDEALRFEHRCQHLTSEGRCGVYGTPERPAACDAYPSHPFDLVGVDGCSYRFIDARGRSV